MHALSNKDFISYNSNRDYTYPPCLLQVLLCGVSGELIDNNIGKRDSLKADHLAVDAGYTLGAIDQYLYTKTFEMNEH
jgi:hypothetical protein